MPTSDDDRDKNLGIYLAGCLPKGSESLAPGESEPGLDELSARQDSLSRMKPLGSKEAVLTFSAKDLLVRLVRATATIRCDPTDPKAPLRLHDDGCLEVALQVADVNELLQAGFIKRESGAVYRVSVEGKRAAGWAAAADAAKSAATY
jgi:hypothetical protein